MIHAHWFVATAQLVVGMIWSGASFCLLLCVCGMKSLTADHYGYFTARTLNRNLDLLGQTAHLVVTCFTFRCHVGHRFEKDPQLDGG